MTSRRQRGGCSAVITSLATFQEAANVRTYVILLYMCIFKAVGLLIRITYDDPELFIFRACDIPPVYQISRGSTAHSLRRYVNCKVVPNATAAHPCRPLKQSRRGLAAPLDGHVARAVFVIAVAVVPYLTVYVDLFRVTNTSPTVVRPQRARTNFAQGRNTHPWLLQFT